MPDDALLQSAHFPMDQLAGRTVYAAAGCEKCHGTGFRGRTGIYEVFQVTEDIEPLIVAREPTSKIKQKAISLGMRTLRDDGWDKVLQGMTTIEEILRASEENE
jgi:type IV pilus assembly protein PilB